MKQIPVGWSSMTFTLVVYIRHNTLNTLDDSLWAICRKLSLKLNGRHMSIRARHHHVTSARVRPVWLVVIGPSLSSRERTLTIDDSLAEFYRVGQVPSTFCSLIQVDWIGSNAANFGITMYLPWLASYRLSADVNHLHRPPHPFSLLLLLSNNKRPRSCNCQTDLPSNHRRRPNCDDPIK